MKIALRRDLGGYALDVVAASDIDGLEIQKPFVLLTGPNGSGKSALMRAIRATIGLRGERAGQLNEEFVHHLDPKSETDVGRLATYRRESRDGAEPQKHVPAVLDLEQLGWSGQPTYYFDSRAASSLASKGSIDDDIGFHISMIAGGGANVSHGQFVSKSWWDALHWAVGLSEEKTAWENQHVTPARRKVLEEGLKEDAPSAERWLFIDEPETAIDAEALMIGLSVLLKIAEEGRLRVFCASHSLLFAAGLAKHEKVQVVDMGGKSPWFNTQEIVLRIAGDRDKIESIGEDIVSRMKSGIRKGDKPSRRGVGKRR